MVEARKFLEPSRDHEVAAKPPEKKVLDYEEFWFELDRENPIDYERHWTPERRKSYLEDGAEFLVDVRDQGIQTMVFMDKSARPLALFLRMLWRRVYPDKEPPEMRFAVGSRSDETNEEDKTALLRQIRELYRKKDFDKKGVLFVDEEMSTGNTLVGTSNLFKQVFPSMQVKFGALSATHPSTAEKFLTIQPPSGSYYKTFFYHCPRNLAQVIHDSKDSHRQTEVEEQSDSIIARARKMPQKAKWTYRLMLVGKHETLDEKSLEGIDNRMKGVTTEDEKERLQKIREAYEKLMGA